MHKGAVGRYGIYFAIELFELLINTDLDQVLDVPLTHQMDMIVYNTDKIADYNFASDYAFLDVTQITPAE